MTKIDYHCNRDTLFPFAINEVFQFIHSFILPRNHKPFTIDITNLKILMRAYH